MDFDDTNHELSVDSYYTLAYIKNLFPKTIPFVSNQQSILSSIDINLSSYLLVGQTFTNYTDGAFSNMFKDQSYVQYINVPNIYGNLIQGYVQKTPTTNRIKASGTYIGDMINGLGAVSVILPNLSGWTQRNSNQSGWGYNSYVIRNFYAPNMSAFTPAAAFLSDAYNLSSLTLPDEIVVKRATSGLGNIPSLQSMFYHCARLSALPFHTIRTDYPTTKLSFQDFCRKCTALQYVDLTIDLSSGNSMNMISAFAECTKLSAATIRFESTKEISLSSNNHCLSCMFKGDSALQRVDVYGVLSTGQAGVVANNYNTWHEAMSGTTSNSQLWIHDTRAIIGSTGAGTALQRWINVGCKDLYFPNVSNIVNRYVFGGLGSKTTGIHFAAEHKDALTATTGYQYKWTLPSTCTIYFDL